MLELSCFPFPSRAPFQYQVGLMSSTLPRLFWIALALAALIFAVPLRSQDTSTGAVRGNVLDPDGHAVAYATVAIVNSATGATRSAVTDASGRFAVELLSPGDYSARAEIQGMSPQVTPQIHVDVGGSVELQFRLSMAGASETVTVSGAPPLVETVPSSVSTVIDERAINELPLNGRRFTDLSLLAPGVTQDPRGLTSTSNGDLAFGGIRGYQSSYLVDGADNNNAFFAQARGRYRAPYQFSNEVVQEFRVSSNTYGAELGRAGRRGGQRRHQVRIQPFARNRLSISFATAASARNRPFWTSSPTTANTSSAGRSADPSDPTASSSLPATTSTFFTCPRSCNFAERQDRCWFRKRAAGPLQAGDYEENDKALVFAAAAQLNKLAGNYPRRPARKHRLFQSGCDSHAAPSSFRAPEHFAILRNQQRLLRSHQPDHQFRAQRQRRRKRLHRIRIGRADQRHFHPAREPSAGAIFPRSAVLERQLRRCPRTHITNVLDGIGRSTILPRETREHRLHFADTLSFEQGRHSWKFGGDALLTTDLQLLPVDVWRRILSTTPSRSIPGLSNPCATG